MTDQMKAKRVLITGGGTGIGRCIALACAARGAQVVVAARRREPIERTAAECGGAAIELDVTDEDSVRRCVERAGRVDVLVNNAAAFAGGTVDALAIGDWDRAIATNLRGPFLMSRAVLPQMQERRSGDIVMIASTSGKRADAGGAAYAASKFGLMGLSEALMRECREYDIRVLTVSPSSVALEDGGGAPKHRLSGDDVARAVVDALCLPRRVLLRDLELWTTNP